MQLLAGSKGCFGKENHLREKNHSLNEIIIPVVMFPLHVLLK